MLVCSCSCAACCLQHVSVQLVHACAAEHMLSAAVLLLKASTITMCCLVVCRGCIDKLAHHLQGELACHALCDACIARRFVQIAADMLLAQCPSAGPPPGDWMTNSQQPCRQPCMALPPMLHATSNWTACRGSPVTLHPAPPVSPALLQARAPPSAECGSSSSSLLSRSAARGRGCLDSAVHLHAWLGCRGRHHHQQRLLQAEVL